MKPMRYLLKGTVAAHWRHAGHGSFVPIRGYTRHDPALPDALPVDGGTVGILKRWLRQGEEGGRKAAAAILRLLREGKITREQIEDTFGNARMPTIAEQGLRRKPEVYEAMVNRTEDGYRVFLETLGIEGMAKAHVKAHARRTPKGGMTRVRDYEDRRLKRDRDAAAMLDKISDAAREFSWKTEHEQIATLEALWNKDRDAFVGFVVGCWHTNRVWRCFEDDTPEPASLRSSWKRQDVRALGVQLSDMFRGRFLREVDSRSPSWLFEPKTIAQAATRQWTEGSRSFGAYLLGLAARDASGADWALPSRHEHHEASRDAAKLLEGTLFYRRTCQAIRAMRKEARAAHQPGDYTLYRGVRQVHARACTLESWTDDFETAESFDGGGVLQKELDPDDILTWHSSSWWGGDSSEHEFVLLGERR